jgi:hypothetical protein
MPGSTYLCCNLHILQQNRFRKSTVGRDIADIAGGHHDAGQSTVNYGGRCSSVAPHYGDHEIATARLKQPLTLAGGGGREEDRLFPKNNGR